MNELELRCLEFAIQVRDFCRVLKHDVINIEYIKQVIRASASIGANYIEANEKLGKQDLLMKLRISRREAKETHYFLHLVITDNETKRLELLKEAEELKKIFSSIINKLL